MSRSVVAGSSNVSVEIRIIDAVDGSPETGVTAATAGLALAYRRQFEANVPMTMNNLAALTTAHADFGFLHIGNGYYRVDLPDIACAIGQLSVLVHGTVTGMVVLGELIQLGPPVATTSDLETAMSDMIVQYRLDEFAAFTATAGSQPPVNGSFMHLLMSALASGFPYDQTVHSLQAIGSRLPPALINNRMVSNVESINDSAEAAQDLRFSAGTIVRGTAVSGTLSTTQMTTDLTETTDNHYKGRILIWTSGALKDQATDVSGYLGATKRFTYTATTEAPAAGDAFVLV